MASYDNDMKCVIAEAGAMDAIIEELGCFSHRTGVCIRFYASTYTRSLRNVPTMIPT
jgi:hypothetical protein